jgi:hypothetical protein
VVMNRKVPVRPPARFVRLGVFTFEALTNKR